MRPLMPLLLSCVAVALWSATDVSRLWMRKLQSAFARHDLSPKVLAIEMGLAERQIYDQLTLRQPMHLERLWEVWALHPSAYEDYCIEHLESHGYRVFRESRLTDALERLLGEKKPMARASLPEPIIEKAS